MWHRKKQWWHMLRALCKRNVSGSLGKSASILSPSFAVMRIISDSVYAYVCCQVWLSLSAMYVTSRCRATMTLGLVHVIMFGETWALEFCLTLVCRS